MPDKLDNLGAAADKPACRISADVLDRTRGMARKLLDGVGKGHGYDHAERVEKMALRFAGPRSDQSIVSLIALLHDVDDYKFFPNTGLDLPNAHRIMRGAGVPDRIAIQIRREINLLGYHNRLAGRSPGSIEAQAVSDADMCDIMGATGILRLMEYAAAHGEKFFDPDDIPIKDLTPDSYAACVHESCCRHIFDKILRLPGFMLTEKGREEALLRAETNASFLKALFRENGNEKWALYLDRFLDGDMSPAGIFW